MIVVCLVLATNAFAQHAADSKTTEKQDDAKIDYQQMGAPMPPLKLFLYHDTSGKNMPRPASVNDGSGSNPYSSGRSKKKKERLTDDRNKIYLTEKDVDNGANLFVMIFNPSCSHCEDETAIIQNSFSLFKKTQLVMVAKPASVLPLGDFYARRKLSDFKSIHIGTDSSGFISRTFVFGMLPQINVYNADRVLIKTFNGEIAIDSLKPYIE